MGMLVQALRFPGSSLLMHLGAAEDGSSTYAPASHVLDPDGVPGFGQELWPAPGAAAILGENEQMKDLFLCAF